MHGRLPSLLLAISLGALLSGCGANGKTPTTAPLASSAKSTGSGAPDLPPPSDFVEGIDNPYLGFAAGRTFRYETQTPEGLETTVVEVTRRTKTILGVETTVVHDRVYLDGELTEDTFDWYAQDEDGNVWYFGEDTKELDNGQVVSTEGSWEAGVDGAAPGIAMLANPEVGARYYQEQARGVAEDQAKVVGVSESVTVRYGTFTGCLKTLEWTRLSPGVREFKYYAPGVGLVLVEDKSGDREELVSIK